MTHREGGRRTRGTPNYDPSFPTISVITPVYNGAKYLECALRSIHDQQYPNLEHIVIDGNSTDDTVSILERWSDRIDYWRSGSDNGMYDALAKGFALSHGEIMAWLNADDMYMPWTFRAVTSLFRNRDVRWLTGTSSLWSPTGVNHAIPLITKLYPSPLIRLGLFHGKSLGYIQQESTFWKRSLWDASGGLDRSSRYAGDYHLWKSFSRRARLHTADCVLAGFRRHGDQLSASGDGYLREVGSDVNIGASLIGQLRYLALPMISVMCRPTHLVKYDPALENEVNSRRTGPRTLAPSPPNETDTPSGARD